MKKMDKLEMAFILAFPLTVLVLTLLMGYYATTAAETVLKHVA